MSWGVQVLADRSQGPAAGWRLQDGFGGRMRVRVFQIEGPIIRVLAVGALEAGDRAHICRLSLVEGGQTLALKPGGQGIRTSRTQAVPVDHSTRDPVQPAWVRQSGVGRWAVPARSVVAALMLFVVPLALHQRRVPLPFTLNRTSCQL